MLRLFQKNYRATLSITSKIFNWVRTKVNSKQGVRDSLMNKDLVGSWGFFNKVLLKNKIKEEEQVVQVSKREIGKQKPKI